jgi:predicted ATPase/DNA-binding CsgD family transcriptional regulator/Tfp pilus assembly protein PilF
LPPNNLPSQRTSFIGREREITDIARALTSARLLTLKGPGGTGKTRLSIKLANHSLEDYPDGVWFVSLDALTDPSLVAPTVAAMLDLPEKPGRTFSDILVEGLSNRKALIVLDNCEHLVKACASLVNTLLRACDDLHFLATSRQPLNVKWEIVWPVPSMSIPEDPLHLPPLEELNRYEALQLFVERARLKLPDFALTPENGPFIAKLCHGLDGMPLALELAAARTPVLSVEQIVARLDERFRLFTGGGHNVSPRQKTLRAAIDWSYDLLPQTEQLLLSRLSVFAGGCSLEAVTGICEPEANEYDIIDLLANLIDKSLVVAEDRGSEVRYRLLNTIRSYAWDKLQASGEIQSLRNRHLDWYVRLAETARLALQGPNQKRWLERLETEHDNLRAALQWALSNAECGMRIAEYPDPNTQSAIRNPHSVEAGLQLVRALWRFWWMHGHMSEGRHWAEQALAIRDSQRPDLLAGALHGSGTLASSQGDYIQAKTLLDESLALYRQIDDNAGVARVLDGLGVLAARQSNYRDAALLFMESLSLRRELGDKTGIDSSLNNLGHVATVQGDYVWARTLLEESLSISRELGDTAGIGVTLNNLGHVALNLGDYPTASALYQESLQIKRELADKVGIASSLNSLGSVARHESRYVDAQGLYEESLALFRELGHKEMIVALLNNLGHVYSVVGDYVPARVLYRESLVTLRDLGDKQAVATALVGLAHVAGRQGQLEWAARLFGAAQSLLTATGTQLEPNDRDTFEVSMASVNALLGKEKWQQAWETGQAMTPAQAIDMALSIPNPPNRGSHIESAESVKAAPAQIPFELTRREVEVLALLSSGLSDAEIAKRLFLSRHTIHAHLRTIFNKLGVTSRLAAARLAMDHGLA